jgi:hypothetical protein
MGVSLESLKKFLELLEQYRSATQALIAIALFVLGYILQRRARIQASLSAWNAYRTGIRNFADEVIKVMSRVEGLCEAKPEILKQEFWNRYNELISCLSALRDQGRLLLPNVHEDVIGQSKSSAYRGLRQATLDCVTAAFYCTIALNYQESANNLKPFLIFEAQYDDLPQAKWLRKAFNTLPKTPPRDGPRRTKGKGWSCKDLLIESKRQFVSETQQIIDPKRWTKMVQYVSP